MWRCGIGTRRWKEGDQTPPRSPPTGETWVKVGGKDAWIYVALDPRTLLIFVETFLSL